MIKIFVVDDEIMAINYFKSLIEKYNSNAEVVGSAINGEIALEHIKNLSPDVVFVDINMPVMNGLEISAKLLEDNPRQKIVLLTSYSDFDYIKQGMDLGIETYLLKNELSIDSLQKVLKRLEEEIEEENQKFTLYAEHHLRQFLLGYEPVFEWGKDIFSNENIMELFYITRKKSFSVIKQEIGLSEIDYKSFLKEQKDNKINCLEFVRINDSCWCGIYAFSKEMITIEKEKAICFIRDYFTSRNLSILTVKSGEFNDIKSLPFLFKKAQKVEKVKLFYGDMESIELNQVKEKSNEPSNFIKLEVELGEAIENGDKNRERKIVNEYLNCLRTLDEDEGYEENIRIIFRSYYRFLKQKNMERFIDSKWMLETFESVDKIETWLGSRIIDFHKIMLQNQATGYSRITLLALTYIHKNYEKNISAQTIADDMNISEGHIRRVFKEEMNLTVADYLTNYRITKAKEFMKKGDIRVTQVYQRVGFTSSQYFSSVFKKNVGISPSEYNRKCREKNEESNI